MSTINESPTTSDPPTNHEPPSIPVLLLPPDERLRRVCALLDALSDALQSDAREFSSHFDGRSLVCELAITELQTASHDLERNVIQQRSAA